MFYTQAKQLITQAKQLILNDGVDYSYLYQ